MRRTSAEEWAKRVEGWKDSGLTATEFCRETGLNPRTLSWWAWKLTKGGRSKANGADMRGAGGSARRQEGGRREVKPSKGATAFVEIPLEAVSAPRGELELSLGGPFRVRVPVGFDEATLTQVIRAVGAAR